MSEKQLLKKDSKHGPASLKHQNYQIHKINRSDYFVQYFLKSSKPSQKVDGIHSDLANFGEKVNRN